MLGFHLPHRGLCAEWISCLNSWFIFTLWHHTSHNVSQFLYRINGIKNGLFSSSSHKSTFFSFAFESWFLINFSHCKKLKWRQAWFICLFHELLQILHLSESGAVWGTPEENHHDGRTWGFWRGVRPNRGQSHLLWPKGGSCLGENQKLDVFVRRSIWVLGVER